MSSIYFPFEQYIHSTIEKEYIQDVKKKNNIVKYINVLLEDPYDKPTLIKLAYALMFFRNTFCKESFLFFFLDKFDKREKELLSCAIFDMFVRSRQGHICEVKEHISLSIDLQKFIIYNDDIRDIWEEIVLELNLI